MLDYRRVNPKIFFVVGQFHPLEPTEATFTEVFLVIGIPLGILVNLFCGSTFFLEDFHIPKGHLWMNFPESFIHSGSFGHFEKYLDHSQVRLRNSSDIFHMEPWNLGTLDPWNLGSLEPWNLGSLEPWNLGSLEPWIPLFLLGHIIFECFFSSATPLRAYEFNGIFRDPQ